MVFMRGDWTGTSGIALFILQTVLFLIQNGSVEKIQCKKLNSHIELIIRFQLNT